MNYQIFQYPLPCPAEPAELNHYLASHRVVGVTQHLAMVAETPTLVFVVQTADGSPKEQGKPRERIDYREVLSPEDFQRYSELRDFRKSLAARDGIPVYGVFTNAQLAEVVQSKVATVAGLAKVEGLGEARLKKYGSALLEFIERGGNPNQEGESEKSRKPI